MLPQAYGEWCSVPVLELSSSSSSSSSSTHSLVNFNMYDTLITGPAYNTIQRTLLS
jgi:hypothetical protein